MQQRITGISATATTIVVPGRQLPVVTCACGLRSTTRAPSGCCYYEPTFTARKQVATPTLHGHHGINGDRIAGGWHGHLYPTGAVRIRVQIPRDQAHHARVDQAAPMASQLAPFGQSAAFYRATAEMTRRRRLAVARER